MSLSDLIGMISAVANLSLAITTVKTVRQSKRSTDASIEALDHMKDALMPQLQLEVVPTTDLKIRPDYIQKLALGLSVKNIGTGSGTLRLITHRNELENKWSTHGFIYHDDNGQLSLSPIKDFLIGSKESYKFELMPSNEFPRQEGNSSKMVSSLSLFYEDVYGRFYRSRIVYTLCYKDSKLTVEPVGKKITIKIKEIPSLLTNNNWIGTRNQIEGGTMVPYRQEFYDLYDVESLEKTIGLVIQGNEVSRGKHITIIKIGFSNNGYAFFDLRLVRSRPFSLEQETTEDNGRTKIVLRDANTVLDTERKLRHDDWGLIGTEPDDLSCLYYYVLSEIRKIDIVSPKDPPVTGRSV